MREIKFRLWDQIRKEFLYSADLHYTKSFRDFGNNCFYDWLGSLSQYTGLKDKNGKEIYEGDIISDITAAGFDNQILEVMWSEYETKYVLAESGVNIRYNAYWNIPRQYANSTTVSGKIIGNIYENRELLSGAIE